MAYIYLKPGTLFANTNDILHHCSPDTGVGTKLQEETVYNLPSYTAGVRSTARLIENKVLEDFTRFVSFTVSKYTLGKVMYSTSFV